jgi:hypothetical protein
VIVGRLKEPCYRSLVPAAIHGAGKLLGVPCDQFFLPDKDRFYCSELVWECFRDSAGKPLFELAPMTFRKPGSSEPMAIWQNYYAKLGLPIPEGVTGCNPGSLSRSGKINILHVYGRPRGWADETWHPNTGLQPAGILDNHWCFALPYDPLTDRGKRSSTTRGLFRIRPRRGSSHRFSRRKGHNQSYSFGRKSR